MPDVTDRIARAGRTTLRVLTVPFRGDRPLILGVLIALFAAGLLLVSPFQQYLDARSRVEVLQLKDSVLSEEVARLEQRLDDLNNPEFIELVAREQQGLVRPGELAYRIIPPEPGSVPDPAPPREPKNEPSLFDRGWQLLSDLRDAP